VKKLFFFLFFISIFIFAFSQNNGGKKEKPQLTERQKEELALLQKIKLVEGDPAKKVPLLEEFCKKFSDSQFIGWAHYQAIFAYQRLNRFKDMERHALIFMKMYPQEPSIPTLLTYGYTENGEYKKALNLGERTLKLLNSLKRPQNVPESKWNKNVNNLKAILFSSLGEVYFYLSEKNKDKKKLKDSENYFLKALKLNPRDDITNYRLGELYYLDGKLKKAEKYLSNGAVLGGKISENSKKSLIEVLKKENREKYLDRVLEEARKRMGVQVGEGKISKDF